MKHSNGNPSHLHSDAALRPAQAAKDGSLFLGLWASVGCAALPDPFGDSRRGRSSGYPDAKNLMLVFHKRMWRGTRAPCGSGTTTSDYDHRNKEWLFLDLSFARGSAGALVAHAAASLGCRSAVPRLRRRRDPTVIARQSHEDLPGEPVRRGKKSVRQRRCCRPSTSCSSGKGDQKLLE